MSMVLENPRSNCALGGINAVLGAVNRFCPIYHSGPGCCLQNTYGEGIQAGRRLSAYAAEFSLACTNMVEKDVVFGAEKKLRSTVKGAIEVYDADAYFILTGCTAGIIGEDVVSVAEDFQEQGYRVYPVEEAGFSGDAYFGYETVFQTFLRYIVEPDLPKQKNLVNILGIVPFHDPFWSGNLEELTRILRLLGLEVNTFFTEHQGWDNIRRSSAAALNIIVSPWTCKGIEREYEQRFGVPSLRIDGLPVGGTDTTQFVRKVSKALRLDEALTQQVIYDGEDYGYSYMGQAIGELGWRRFAVVGDANTAIGITRFLANDYGFMPLLTVITDNVEDEASRERIRARIADLEYAQPPEVVFAIDQWDVYSALERYPDITLLAASTNEREYGMAHDVPCNVISFPVSDRLIFNRSYAGYKGCLTLLEDLYTNL